MLNLRREHPQMADRPNAAEHHQFDHGYAFSSHSAQGLTIERVLVHADTGVHTDLLNSRFGYVSVSRASHEATMFTDNAAKLGQQLAAEVTKTSALETGDTPSVGQGGRDRNVTWGRISICNCRENLTKAVKSFIGH